MGNLTSRLCTYKNIFIKELLLILFLIIIPCGVGGVLDHEQKEMKDISGGL